MTLLKSIIYLLAFFGIVGYLETGNIMYLLPIVIGTIGIIKINLNK